MKPINHFNVSLITGAVTFLTTKAISPSIASFLIGWLLDVDHIWDFYKNGCRRFSVRRFLDAMDNGEIKKAYLYFHSYELLLILISLCFVTHFNYLLSFITLSFAIHLFFDQLFNPVNPLTYFITYRILNNYKTEIIFRANLHEQKVRERV